MNIAAVIVTYNRQDMLSECIDAIRQQTLPVHKIYIIDNASTDNTNDLCVEKQRLDSKIKYIKLEKNIGGAGGFNYGIRLAYENEHDYIWIMDDDSIPNPNALEKLLSNNKLMEIDEWGFVCSNIRWKDGSSCGMNTPTLASNWSELIQFNLLPVKTCSFVSVVFTRKAIQYCGLPIKDFFIWVDDTEYTARISRLFDCFFVTDSLVVHKMASNQNPDIILDESNRLDRYYYEYRNRYYLNKKLGKKMLRKYRKNVAKTVFRVIISSSPQKSMKIKIIASGFWHGIFFQPKIEML